MLVEDVNHPVAKAPEQKQRGDERKGDDEIFTVGGSENIGQFLHGFYEWVRRLSSERRWKASCF
jgi:hypothetical protein